MRTRGRRPPTVSLGYNSRVARTHTVATRVPFDLTRLTLDPADPTVSLVDGKRERMTKRTVTVPVAGGTSVTRSQWWSRYGPVVADPQSDPPLPWTTTTAYALDDPNAAGFRFADSSLGFARARSTAGVLASLRRHQGLPWVNTVAAGSAGHSLYTQSQVLPRITDDLAARCSTDLGKITYPQAGLAV